MSDKETLASKVDPDLAEQVEQLANAEGKTKSEWIREAVEEVASEDSAEMKPEDEIRADVNRVEADVNRVEDKVDQAVELMIAEMQQQNDSSQQSGENAADRIERVERTEDDSSGVSEFAPGGERDPGPLGALNRLMDGD